MAGYRVWTRERLASTDFQQLIQDQVVLVFESAAARDAAVVAPVEGMTCKLLDSDTTWDYTLGGWRGRLGVDSGDWAGGDRGAVNNYDLASLYVNPGRPYRVRVESAGVVTVGAGAVGALRLFDGGTARGVHQIEAQGSSRNHTARVARSFTAWDGAPRTVKANLEVLAGTITTYTDPVHSYLELTWWAI